MEKSVYSDYVFVDAAYKMGWIDRTTRILINKVKQYDYEKYLGVDNRKDFMEQLQ